jgi:hypothetical protein
MTVGYVIVEVYCLTRVLIHKTPINERAILGGDEESWPSNPGEVERLLEARKGGYETTRGHFEVILSTGVLVNCYRQTI